MIRSVYQLHDPELNISQKNLKTIYHTRECWLHAN